MAIVGIVRKALGTKDQITFERADDTDFDTKLVGLSSFTL